jgi:hypothetical protein
MGKLKPIGSEKLEGQNKIARILEISKYKFTEPNSVNEITSNEYNITLSDGNVYHIDKEKNGYVIKKTINEEVSEYLEPMKNRKFYSSYSQAFKRLNLIAKEINTATGNDQGVSLFGEQKKFVLKTPKPEAPSAPAPMPEPIPAPAEMPSEPVIDDLPPAPEGDSEVPPMDDQMMEPSDDEMPTDDMSMDEPEMDPQPEEGNDEEGGAVTFKTIQKLTGKLGQKLRKLNQGDDPISADDTKYVINSILSALDLSVLSDEDMEEIIGRLEDSEMESDEEPEMEEPSDEMDVDQPEDEDLEIEDEDQLPESEMFEEENDEQYEGLMKGEYDLGFSDKPKEQKEMNFNNYVKNKYAGEIKNKMGEMMEDEDIDGLGGVFDSIFSESKVDNIIKSYFVKSDSEKKYLKEQQHNKFLSQKAKKVKIMREVKNLSESFVQESTSSKFLDRYNKARFIGKTNKKNLVFEVSGKQYMITPEGGIL